MLRTTLEFLRDELNLYIKSKDPTNFGNIDSVVLSGLMKPDGTFALSTEGNDIFRIIVTLINVEEDRIAESQNFYEKVNNKIHITNPPLNINAYVLFSVFASNYLTSLRLLSYILSFFQSSLVFENDRYPHLNAKVEADKPWQKISKIIPTLHSTTFEQQNNLWAALGAKYMPSVIYKIRTMTFTDDQPKMETPPIKEINIISN